MNSQQLLQRLVGVTFVVLFLAGCAPGATPLSKTPTIALTPAPPTSMPDFIYTVRAYGGGGYDDFQRRSMKELGLDYVHSSRGSATGESIAAERLACYPGPAMVDTGRDQG
jgi:hypothetical protein